MYMCVCLALWYPVCPIVKVSTVRHYGPLHILALTAKMPLCPHVFTAFLFPGGARPGWVPWEAWGDRRAGEGALGLVGSAFLEDRSLTQGPDCLDLWLSWRLREAWGLDPHLHQGMGITENTPLPSIPWMTCTCSKDVFTLQALL